MRTVRIVGAVLLFLVAFAGTSFAAQAAVPDSQSILDLVKPVWDAVVHGQWWLAAAGGVVMLCALARKYMPASWKEGTKGDIIGTVMAFVMAAAAMIATWAATPGAVMTTGVMITALKVGMLAVGGYNIIHKLAGWIGESVWFQQHAPAWLQGVLKMAAAMFGSDALAKATAAGDAAVAAQPPTGMAGDAGVKEIP